ncbi:hypothetical protein GEMRC1_007827 [Eukaryota sp. GEM-RC1]
MDSINTLEPHHPVSLKSSTSSFSTLIKRDKCIVDTFNELLKLRGLAEHSLTPLDDYTSIHANNSQQSLVSDLQAQVSSLKRQLEDDRRMYQKRISEVEDTLDKTLATQLQKLRKSHSAEIVSLTSEIEALRQENRLLKHSRSSSVKNNSYYDYVLQVPRTPKPKISSSSSDLGFPSEHVADFSLEEFLEDDDV